MNFELNIKNIGKLTDAEIRIGQFTVFAGPNNTGKSTVSKLLYSLFDGMNANPAEAYINDLVELILESSYSLEGWSYRDSLGDGLLPASQFSSLAEKTKILESLAKSYTGDDLEALKQAIFELLKITKDIELKLVDMLLIPKKDAKGKPDDFLIELVRQSVKKLQDALDDIHADQFISCGIGHKIKENLIKNFQVSKISYLSGNLDRPFEADAKNYGKFESRDEKIVYNINRDWFYQFQQYSNIIYLESPVYWKLKNALELVDDYQMRLDSRRKRLNGVPGYFYDLVSALKFEYTGDIAFPDLYERLTGKDILGGKIAISEIGNFSFQENGRSFSLPVTAMGVANLGILALLIERKVLDKNSVLFIDEPEAHLHPAWQVIMVEILFELAKGGVNIVIATHSIDILKWLEVEVKENPESKSLIALNQFPVDSAKNLDQSFEDKMSNILQELTEPFATTFRRGV